MKNFLLDRRKYPLFIVELTINLQKQTFLHRTGTYTCGIKTLKNGQDLFHFFLGHIKILLESQLVGNCSNRAIYKSTIIQRTYQICQTLLASTNKNLKIKTVGNY